MPLDQFHVPGLDTAENDAENVLIVDCLAQSGVDWPVAPSDIDEAVTRHAATTTWSNIPLMTEAVAAKWGYHEADDPVKRAARIAAFKKTNAAATATPGFDALFRPCLDAARKKLPGGSADSVNRLNHYVWEARGAAARQPAVRAAAKKWRECLSSAGYAGMPDDPSDVSTGMPTPELREQAGIPTDGAGDGAPLAPITPQETALALADVACRDSSGWTKTQYAAEWDEEVKIVQKNADRLTRAHDADLAAMKKYLAVIAAHPAKQ
ncbi:hypothetical protein [Microbacterium sp.]|uniref:hypothetical protein n=1 Tax=Microbacterium sp. TaxID=51671 RepID=UPI003A8D0723